MPVAFDQVMLWESSISPSLTVLGATFFVSEEHGDLTQALVTPAEVSATEIYIKVRERFGRLKARVPWYRPRRYQAHIAYKLPAQVRISRILAAIAAIEEDASDWLRGQVAGVFAQRAATPTPAFPLLTIGESDLLGQESWQFSWPFGQVRDGFIREDKNGFAAVLRSSDWQHYPLCFLLSGRVVPTRDAEELYRLLSDFDYDHRNLMAWVSASEVIENLVGDLVALRDGTTNGVLAHTRRRRRLKTFLDAASLDLSTVAREVARIRGADLAIPFTPEYKHQLVPGDPEMDLHKVIGRILAERATNLSLDAEQVVASIHTAIQYRMMISNARLQWMTLLASIGAFAAAVLALAH